MDVQHTIDNRADIVLGQCGLNLRRRIRVLDALKSLRAEPLPAALAALFQRHAARAGAAALHTPPPTFVELVAFGEEGMSITVRDVLVRLPHRVQLGCAADELLLQVGAMASAIAQLPGRWHRGDVQHWRYFSRPVASAFDCAGHVDGDASAAVGTDLPHIWMRCDGVALVIQDDPWESWLGEVMRRCATAGSAQSRETTMYLAAAVVQVLPIWREEIAERDIESWSPAEVSLCASCHHSGGCRHTWVAHVCDRARGADVVSIGEYTTGHLDCGVGRGIVCGRRTLY